MSMVNIFLFAAHHASGNIASQRFRGLLKYLDANEYRVYVFSREGNAAGNKVGATEDEIRLPGYCVGRNSSLLAILISLGAVFFRWLPFLSALRRCCHGKSWLVNALAEADRRCREHMHMGERCVVIGTYSPIDALIASASLAARHDLPCIQDFRDGFVYESLGRKGWLAEIMRRIMEMRVVDPASLVISVSPALVDDFESRYPGKAVKLLPNGFDPDDFLKVATEDEQDALEIMRKCIPQKVRLIGHFGRVGASDASASQSFFHFVNAMNVMGDASLHVLFVGELTPSEKEALNGAKFGVTLLDTMRRGVALRLMGKCDHLLLITGNRVSCATGKVFEYIASGVPVVCFTGVKNSASTIISRAGVGRTVVMRGVDQDVDGLRSAFSFSIKDRDRTEEYSKPVQAREFGLMLDRLVSVGEGARD